MPKILGYGYTHLPYGDDHNWLKGEVISRLFLWNLAEYSSIPVTDDRFRLTSKLIKNLPVREDLERNGHLASQLHIWARANAKVVNWQPTNHKDDQLDRMAMAVEEQIRLVSISTPQHAYGRGVDPPATRQPQSSQSDPSSDDEIAPEPDHSPRMSAKRPRQDDVEGEDGRPSKKARKD